MLVVERKPTITGTKPLKSSRKVEGAINTATKRTLLASVSIWSGARFASAFTLATISAFEL